MKVTIFLLSILCLLLPGLLYAQPGFGDDVSDVPLDGGLSLVLAAGAGYAVNKLRRSQKSK